MIFTLITGFVVGVFYSQARPFIQSVFDRIQLTLEATQMGLTSFAVCLAAAAALLNLVGVHTYPVLLCLGAAIGVARKPLIARITSRSN